RRRTAGPRRPPRRPPHAGRPEQHDSHRQRPPRHLRPRPLPLGPRPGQDPAPRRPPRQAPRGLRRRRLERRRPPLRPRRARRRHRASAVEVMRLLEPIFEKHGFEPLVTFTLITERSLVCVSNLSFDRREPEDAARAKACYDELTATLAREGYISYRTGP